MAPDIIPKVLHVLLEQLIHEGILDGQAPLVGQGGDQHNLTLGELPGDAAVKPQDTDHLILGLDGNRKNGDDSFLLLLLPVLNPFVRSGVLDRHGLSFQGFGDACFPERAAHA